MRKIWKSAETDQNYLIPSDLEWEDESELAAYAVSDEEAQEHLKSALEDAFSGLRDAWNDLRAAQPPPPPPDPDAQAKGREIVKDLLGVTPDEVRADPSAGEQAVKDLFSGVMTFIKSITEEDGSMARQQMANLQTTFAKHGLVSDDADLTTIPDKLGQEYHKSQVKRSAEFADLADAWDSATRSVSETLREYADELATADQADVEQEPTV